MAEQKRDDDLETLLPDRTLTLGGEQVTVREFRFAEGLRITPMVRPILNDLRDLGGMVTQSGDLALFEDLLGRHWDQVLDLVAIVTDRPREWIEQLPDEEGQQLVWTFWAVNAGFFLRRLVSAEAARASRTAAPSPSPTSSPSSSPRDSGPTPPTSPSG